MNKNTDKNTIKITINITDKISDNDEKNIIKMLLSNKTEYFYNKLTNEEIQEILKHYKNINKCIIQSIKSTYIKEHIIFGFENLKKNITSIIDDYKTMNILKLSLKYKNTPLTILRVIFQSSMSKDKVKQIFKNPSVLNDYDFSQFKLAIDNDFYSISDNKQMQEAINFEYKIEDFLNKNNIHYKTQNMLSEEQIKQYGVAINTPDFLITDRKGSNSQSRISDKLLINNHEINWIDAKNFYGSNSKFIIDKIKKQIKKYINTYGNGCIVFSCGYNDKLHFDNVLLLSYKDLNNN